MERQAMSSSLSVEGGMHETDKDYILRVLEV